MNHSIWITDDRFTCANSQNSITANFNVFTTVCVHLHFINKGHILALYQTLKLAFLKAGIVLKF